MGNKTELQKGKSIHKMMPMGDWVDIDVFVDIVVRNAALITAAGNPVFAKNAKKMKEKAEKSIKPIFERIRSWQEKVDINKFVAIPKKFEEYLYINAHEITDKIFWINLNLFIELPFIVVQPLSIINSHPSYLDSADIVLIDLSHIRHRTSSIRMIFRPSVGRTYINPWLCNLLLNIGTYTGESKIMQIAAWMCNIIKQTSEEMISEAKKEWENIVRYVKERIEINYEEKMFEEPQMFYGRTKWFFYDDERDATYIVLGFDSKDGYYHPFNNTVITYYFDTVDSNYYEIIPDHITVRDNKVKLELPSKESLRKMYDTEKIFEIMKETINKIGHIITFFGSEKYEKQRNKLLSIMYMLYRDFVRIFVE